MTIKNILLIQQIGFLNNPDPYLCASYLEPITLEYLAAYISQKGYSVKILAGNISENELLSTIEDFTPFAIGFSIYTYTYLESLKLAKKAKTRARELGYDLITIFGGYHASAMPEEVISHDEIDFVVKGEGEITFHELLDALQNKKDTDKIPGLFFKKNNNIIKTMPRDRIKDIDSLPWPMHDKRFLIDAKQYQLLYPPPSQQKSVARITYSRGCPFACSFCASKSTWEQKVVWRSPKKVLDEIEFLIKNFETNLVSFLDLTFNANKKKVMEICKGFIKRDLPLYWGGLFRPDLLDEEMLQALSKAKCVKLNIGIESPDKTLATDIKTNYEQKAEKIIKSLNIANDLGLILKAFIIIGFPQETKELILFYPQMLQKYPLDELRITFATPFPQTSFWDECINKKLTIQNPAWDGFTTEQPVIKHPSLNNEELIQIREQLVTNFYLSPSYDSHIKNKIHKHPHLKTSFIEYFKFINNKHITNDKNKLTSLINTIQNL